jgi:hypothetical protein
MQLGGLAFNKTLLLLKLLNFLNLKSFIRLVLYDAHQVTYKHTIEIK